MIGTVEIKARMKEIPPKRGAVRRSFSGTTKARDEILITPMQEKLLLTMMEHYRKW